MAKPIQIQTDSNSTGVAPVGLDQLHTIKQVAAVMQRHPISVYKATLGLISMPIPRFVRMGRGIRFRESDVRDFISGLSSGQSAPPTPLGPVKKRGRPTKSEQIAARCAAGGAK